jgi:hypothetical protein
LVESKNKNIAVVAVARSYSQSLSISRAIKYSRIVREKLNQNSESQQWVTQ